MCFLFFHLTVYLRLKKLKISYKTEKDCGVYIQLGFNQYRMSRNTVFIDTKLQPEQRFLKTHAQLKALDSDSEDIYMQKFTCKEIKTA